MTTITADNLPLKIIERFFARHRDKLVFIHGVMFVFFVALLAVPLFIPAPAEDATPFTHFTTFANFVMWGLWFPLVLLSVIFTGRSWCGLLCPMGAASEWANKKGLQREIPRWLRWEGTPIVSFLIVTIWGQTVGVRDHPEAIALVFGATMAAAILIGYFYAKNKRAWCRHACPIGLLLGVFSRIGMLDFAPKAKKPTRDRYTEKGLCPTMIKIPGKDESRHCIECFRCVNPGAKGGLQLKLRPPGHEIETIKNHNPNKSEIWFLFFATGVVLGGFLWLSHPSYQVFREAVGVWFLDHDWYGMFESGPGWLMSVHPERREIFSWLDFTTIISYMLGSMLLFSAVLATGAFLSAILVKKREDTANIFTQLSYQYMPVAMISIVIGLGGELFNSLVLFGAGEGLIASIKIAAFVGAILWSIRIGARILNNLGMKGRAVILPLVPGTLCSTIIGYAWWIAVF